MVIVCCRVSNAGRWDGILVACRRSCGGRSRPPSPRCFNVSITRCGGGRLSRRSPIVSSTPITGSSGRALPASAGFNDPLAALNPTPGRESTDCPRRHGDSRRRPRTTAPSDTEQPVEIARQGPSSPARPTCGSRVRVFGGLCSRLAGKPTAKRYAHPPAGRRLGDATVPPVQSGITAIVAPATHNLPARHTS